MIRWVSDHAEDRVRDYTALARDVGAAPAVRLLAHAAAAPLVLIAERIAQEIVAHLRSSPNEMGGLLVGQAYALPIAPRHGFDHLVAVDAHVPSERFDSSAISLRMDTQLWERAAPLLDAGRSVVGWYHSHPGLGAFFSGTDRATQLGFFRQPYSLGLVVDPVRAELAWYAGPDSAELAPNALVSPSLVPLTALLETRP